MIDYSDITVVLQGSTLGEFNNKRCIEYSIASIKKMLPESKIILSTWEGENISEYLFKQVDKVVFNKDPGFKTRNSKPDGKPNNVNRQIVSTINGLREVETKYAMKMRTDFVLTHRGFLNYFDMYSEFDKEFQIFEKRVLCLMLGSARPYGDYWNLPFHVSDFCTFGLTSDLLKLYDIPLMTDEEADWLNIHSDLAPGYWAKNKFGAEQHIWVNSLMKNGVDVKCKFCVDISEEIAEQSDRCLVNNFCPLPFSVFGIQPLKKNLKAKSWIKYYTEYYTPNEWLGLYKEYCDKNVKICKFDFRKFIINLAIKITEDSYPKILKSLMKRIVSWLL